MGIRVRGPTVFRRLPRTRDERHRLPVLNMFRMFSKMGAQRVAATSDGAVDLDAMMKTGVRDKPDVGALASRDANLLTPPRLALSRR